MDKTGVIIQKLKKKLNEKLKFHSRSLVTQGARVCEENFFQKKIFRSVIFFGN